MTSPFKDCRTFLHMDCRLDDPNYVPAKDKSRRKDDKNEGAVSTFLEEEPYQFFHMDYRLDMPRKSKKPKMRVRQNRCFSLNS